MAASRLEVRGFRKVYGDRAALDGLDLDVPRSTMLVVVGPNGSGKSTLLGCLAGVLHHDGTATLDGVPLRPADGRVAYLPQRLRLPPTATVADVLGLMRGLAMGRPDRAPLPHDFVPDGARRIGELSGGQAQRVGLAGVLMGEPDLLLLDEPFANLDDNARAIVSSVLCAHRDAGALVVITNPAAHEVLASADLVVRIDAGRLASVAPAPAPAPAAVALAARFARSEGAA